MTGNLFTGTAPLLGDGLPALGDVRWVAAREFGVNWSDVTPSMVDDVLCPNCSAAYKSPRQTACDWCLADAADAREDARRRLYGALTAAVDALVEDGADPSDIARHASSAAHDAVYAYSYER